MSTALPSQPMSATEVSRRKPRVCTREACETCREKKSKCDGEQPCSRCDARGLECRYQVRNYRSKRSLRNELHALKEKQRLHEILFAALQDPRRRDAALRLLETKDPIAGVEKLFLKDELNTEQREVEGINDHDDEDRSTSGSASPSPEHQLQQPAVKNFTTSPTSTKISPVRSNSAASSLAGRSDSLSMPTTSDSYVDHMNPFVLAGNSPMFHQFTQSYNTNLRSLPGGSFLSSAEGLANSYGHNWMDPALTGRDEVGMSQQNPPFQQLNGGNPSSWNGEMGGQFGNHVDGNDAGIMMAQGGSHQLPQTSNLAHFGQWNSPHAGAVDNRRLSEPSSSSLYGVGGLTPPATLDTPPLPHKASVAAPSQRRQRASISSATSTQSHPRSMSRERHRLASARNWHKQKQATADLEATKARVEAQHAALREEYTDVLNQVQQIKHVLLGHAACNDPAIKMWLQREADGVLAGLQQPGPGGDGVIPGQASVSGGQVEGSAVAYPPPSGRAAGERSETTLGDDIMTRGGEVNVVA